MLKRRKWKQREQGGNRGNVTAEECQRVMALNNKFVQRGVCVSVVTDTASKRQPSKDTVF